MMLCRYIPSPAADDARVTSLFSRVKDKCAVYQRASEIPDEQFIDGMESWGIAPHVREK